MPLHADRVKMTVTGTPGTGTVTLNAASSGYQSFATAYGANATVDVMFEDGTAWETAEGCTYTHSGTTLSRGTFKASSTGSALSLTSASTASVAPIASTGNKWETNARGLIIGGKVSYSSSTVITVSACQIAINGKLLSTSSTTTLTSASTMKDLAGSTVTLGASKAYFVYAFDNAGTLEFRVQDYAAATYGGAPTFSTDYDYWIAPSVGAQGRRIGKFWTNGSSNILVFWQYTVGYRSRKTHFARNAVALLTGGTSSSYASLTITPYVTADDESFCLHEKLDVSTGTSAASNLFISVNSGTTDYQVLAVNVQTASVATALPDAEIANTGTLHYKTSTANPSIGIDLNAFVEFV